MHRITPKPRCLPVGVFVPSKVQMPSSASVSSSSSVRYGGSHGARTTRLMVRMKFDGLTNRCLSFEDISSLPIQYEYCLDHSFLPFHPYLTLEGGAVHDQAPLQA